MTAGAGARQSSRSHRPGRIIERPRLIKQLDAAEAPVILIVAPAGYGKTTLARQWAKTLSGVIWVSCTPAHRDVVTFAEDIALGIDALGGSASQFIGEYVRTRNDPQQAARAIAGALARRIKETKTPMRWLIIDDYQELTETPEAEQFFAVLRDRVQARILISSRVRPPWVKARHLLYREVDEIGSSDLALTSDESAAVLGSRPELDNLVRKAEGWPAVVGLAAALKDVQPLDHVTAGLHRYLADELFGALETHLQDQLIELALLPNLSPDQLHARFGQQAASVVASATSLGFLASAAGDPELHPLLRDFLLSKVAAAGETSRLRDAVDAALESHRWAFALDLVLRFRLDDLIDHVLEASFAPLVRSGRLETLRSFITVVRETTGLPAPAVDVVDAELAMRNGNFELAAGLATRAAERLATAHGLRCPALLLTGRAQFFLGGFDISATAYRDAADAARDATDKLDSIFGLASTQTFGERGDPGPAVEELRRIRHASSRALVRYATADLNLRRYTGLGGETLLEEAVHALPSVPDPLVRTAFTYTSGYLLAIRGEYRRAEELLALFARDIQDFELDFARPFLEWTQALVDLGLRRFGDADRRLQRVEDAAADQRHESHDLNARLLRARLLLQTGESRAALEILNFADHEHTIPSWRGELSATRALVLACNGESEAASEAAEAGVALTRFVEVAVLAQSARALADALGGRGMDASYSLFEEARRSDVWDPVLCALRASDQFVTMVAADERLRTPLSRLLHRVGDAPLARRVGLRTRSTHLPSDLLSRREIEVIGLMARGMRNKEIATALFVAESTVKVHVRHILEKLGVGTRAAAVARWERVARR